MSKRPRVDVLLYDYTVGFNVQPKPFVFDLKPRDEGRRLFIERTWEDRKNAPVDTVVGL